MTDRNDERDTAIWRAYLSGQTQHQIAREHGLDQTRISQIIRRIRDTIPPEVREHLVQREASFLDELRQEAMKLVYASPIPAYSNGRPIVMADGETIAEDHSGRLTAIKVAADLHKRLADLLGLAAPTTANITVSHGEQEAAAQIAAEAVSFLHSTEPDGP